MNQSVILAYKRRTRQTLKAHSNRWGGDDAMLMHTATDRLLTGGPGAMMLKGLLE